MKLFLIGALALFIGFSSNAQKAVPPQAAKNTFMQKFPNAQKVTWDKENATEYEAGFTLNGVKMSSNINTEGKWMETETTIKVSELPENIKSAIVAKYPTAKITGAAKIETLNDGIRYEADLKTGLKKSEVLFSENGKFVK